MAKSVDGEEMTRQEQAIDAAETIATGTRPTKGRLADLAGGMGKKVESIKGKEITVTAIEISTREVRSLNDEEPSEEHPNGVREGDLITKKVAFISSDETDSAGNPQRYYTFSDPLISKLEGIDNEALPLLAIFNLVDIPGGKRAWTIE